MELKVRFGIDAFNVPELIFRFVAYKLVLKVFRRRFDTLFVKFVEAKVTFVIDAFKVPELRFVRLDTIDVFIVFM